MSFFDLSRHELEAYRPARSEPADFDAFWQATLSDARSHSLNVTFTLADFHLTAFETYDISFAGYGGQAIKGWLILPAGSTEPIPCLVEYIGYGGGRGYPYQWLAYPSAGYATLVMDTRGQGSSWLHGDTPDLPDGANPHTPGFMTQGILDPNTYYYRRLITDAVRAVEAARSHPRIDAERIGVTGRSQGGALALITSALDPSIPVTMPSVPFLSHFRRSVGLTDKLPYAEIATYLSVHRDRVEQVFNTLDYFDCMNFAPRIKAQALFSTALMDDVCSPSSVFAAYNYVASPKTIKVYDFNNHEGGGIEHLKTELAFLKSVWG